MEYMRKPIEDELRIAQKGRNKPNKVERHEKELYIINQKPQVPGKTYKLKLKIMIAGHCGKQETERNLSEKTWFAQHSNGMA